MKGELYRLQEIDARNIDMSNLVDYMFASFQNTGIMLNYSSVQKRGIT